MLVMLCATSCTHKGSPGSYSDVFVQVKEGQPIPPWDYCLTWRDYDGDDPSQATYVWDGEEIGKGGIGFLHLIEEIKIRMTRGQRILVYPAYGYFEVKTHGDWTISPMMTPPPRKDILIDVLRSQGVVMLLSDRDIAGNRIVP